MTFWLWFDLAVVLILLLIFFVVDLKIYRANLVKDYKHGVPYGFAGWKNFKAMVIEPLKAEWRGESSPQTIPIATIPYPKWVIERAEKEGSCNCPRCNMIKILEKTSEILEKASKEKKTS